jgi:hypothetical protein
LSYPVLFYPVLFYPVLSCPILSCPVLSCPVLSYPVLPCPVLSYPVLSCPVLSYPVLSCPVLSYSILTALASLILIPIPHVRYEFREPALREAVLLLVRAVAETYLHPTTPALALAGEGLLSKGTNGSISSSSSSSSIISSSSGWSPRSAQSSIEGHLVVSLVFLQARCSGECDVVPDVAKRYASVRGEKASVGDS